MTKKIYLKILEKRYDILNGLIALGILFIVVQNVTLHRNIAIVDDQLGYWGIAAKLAGYDWSEMVSMTAYYGFGYPILLVPLFWLGAEPAVIYQLSILLNAGMLIISFFLAVSCIKIVFPDMDKLLQSVVCLLVTMYGNNLAQVYTAWTETLLYLLFWIVFYLILLIDRHLTFLKLVLLIVVCGYMYAVHQRSVGVCIAVFIVLTVKILFNIEGRKKLFWIGGGFVFACLLFAGIAVFKNVLVNTLWIGAEADVMSLNDYGGQIDKIKGLFNTEGLIELFQSICGRIYYLIAGTMFSGAFGLVYAARGIWSYVAGVRHCGVRKDSIKTQSGLSPFLFVFLSLLAEIGISAIFMYMNHTRIDILVYGRYMEFVFGPLMLLGFGFLLMYKPILTFAGISSVFLICTITVETLYEGMKSLPFNHSCATQLLQFFNSKEWERDNLFFCIAQLIIFAMLLSLIVLRKKIWLGSTVLIIICFKFWSGNFDSVMTINKNWNQRFVESFEPVRELLKENNVMEITFLDSTTEVADAYINADLYMKQLQFTIYELTMHRKVIEDVRNLVLEENQWYIFQKKIAEEADLKNLDVEVILDNKIFIVIKK